MTPFVNVTRSITDLILYQERSSIGDISYHVNALILMINLLVTRVCMMQVRCNFVCWTRNYGQYNLSFAHFCKNFKKIYIKITEILAKLKFIKYNPRWGN